MLVCEECGSKDIEQKAWVDANTNEYKDTASDGDTEDNYCNKCGAHARFINEEDFEGVKSTKKVVGYQVVDVNNNIHPHIEGSWIVLSKPEAIELIKSYEAKWKLLTIFEGDIEEGNKTFEGDPDNPTDTGEYLDL